MLAIFVMNPHGNTWTGEDNVKTWSDKRKYICNQIL
jgi:hypothetical protein